MWLYETGTDNRTYMRRYGYAIHGDTPRYHRSLNRGNRISVITALSTDGLVAMELIMEILLWISFLILLGKPHSLHELL